MDPKDRLFAEIALRMQLLTREQIQTCAQRGAGRAGRSIGDVAVELGFLTEDEVSLLLAREARLLERRRAPSPGAVEERPSRRQDPRSASSPPPPPAAARAQGKRRRAWEAPSGEAPGQVRIQQVPSARSVNATQPMPPPVPRMTAPAPPSELADTAPVPQGASIRAGARSMPAGARSMPAAARSVPSPEPSLRQRSSELADTAPLQPAPAVPAYAGFEAFPMADGSDGAAPAAAQGWANAPLDLEPRASQGVSSTLAGTGPGRPASAPLAGTLAGAGPVQLSAVPVSAAATMLQSPALVGPAAVVPFQGPHERPATRPPPKTKAERPAPEVEPSASYLGKALALAMQKGASDLHAHSGSPLLVRVDGQLRPLSSTALLNAEAAERVIAEIMTDEQWATLSRRGEVDFAYEIPGLARFRVNIYSQQRGLDAVFRIIAGRPPTLEELGLPARLSRLTDFRTGMVLCTGPAGCGKSTTLAALLATLTKTRSDHVLTIEDPVEYVYEGGAALVNQRQVHAHTASFARALRAALREDPDVIAITELRDRDTIGLAISAAETGHLVLGTLHTGNASQTITRIVSSFPADEQEQVRAMLAESLRAVVSQRLVPCASGKGRVPAIELLMVNTAVSNLIREDKTYQLPSVMQTGKAAGMITLDDSLAELVAQGVVTSDAARKYATRKERFG